MTDKDGHVHLHVESARPAWDWARWLVVALGAAGVLLFVLAFFQAWWGFVLYAPQYLLAIPALAFPILFLADSFYWLYTFGHRLDPRAPLKIGTFTPQLFGNGKIGQFETYATPSAGFWIAVAGVACVVLATVVRSRVCAHCNQAATCKASCARFLVLPDHAERAS